VQQRTKLTPLAEAYDQYVEYSQLLAAAATTQTPLSPEEVAELRAKTEQVTCKLGKTVTDPPS
jgi:hypothetical protein